MAYLLKLDSSEASTTHDFTINYSNFELERDIDYEVALVKASLWYSYHNISSSFSNNVIAYYNGSVWRSDITIPNGMYGITELETYIQAQMTSNGDTASNITFDPNYNTMKLTITLSGGYQVDLSKSNIYSILGFNSGILTTTTTSPNAVDVTRGVNDLLINCSLVSGSAYDNGIKSDTLYSFVPDVSPGYLMTVSPPELIYIPIRERNNIQTIRLHISDQLSRAVNLNGEPTSYLLHLRPKIA